MRADCPGRWCGVWYAVADGRFGVPGEPQRAHRGPALRDYGPGVRKREGAALCLENASTSEGGGEMGWERREESC
eukprot:8912316-Pyramimonas_sp.AAC.1